MHRHAGQRKHIVSELSVVGYELLVFSFLLYPNVFDLAMRSFAQYAASRPTRLVPDRSLRLWMLSIAVFHAHASLILLFPVNNAGGLVLDFVGSDRVPSRLLLLGVNVLILALQLVQICITHELGAAAANTERGILDPDPDANPDLVLHLRFRKTLDRIAHPPAPPPPLELPAPGAAAGAAAQRRQQQHLASVFRSALVRQLAQHARGP